MLDQVCGHKTIKVSYRVSSKAYTLTQPRAVDSLALKITTPYEYTRDKRPQLTYTIGEKWGLKTASTLSDRKASYPLVLQTWKWADPPQGDVLITVEYQVPEGVQCSADQVTLSVLTHQGKTLPVKYSKKDWKHVDDLATKVAVLAFVVVDPAPGELDAGVLLHLYDGTTFTGDRDAYWQTSIQLLDPKFQEMQPETMAVLMEDVQLMREGNDLVEIGYPVSRRDSISSSIGFPDVAGGGR